MILVIDSTEYKQDRTFNKRNLASIKDYGKHKLIELHVPHIVYMEVLTTIINELNQDINQAKNSISGLESKGLSNKDSKITKEAVKSLESLLPNVQISAENLWKDFIKESKAKLHPFYEEDSTIVFDSYFKGLRPFKTIKSRNDIPDAFIYQTILRLADKKKDVYVITNDDNLRQSFEDFPKIKTYSSLKSFFESPKFKILETKLKSKLDSVRIEEGKDLLMDFKYVFEEAVEKYVSNLHYFEIDETALPSDNGEATIQAVDDVEVIIDRNQMEFINDSFYIPITVKAIASVDFFVAKHDYWSIENLPTGSEWNDWVYLCEDTYPIEMRKTIILNKDEFNEDLEPEIEIGKFDEIHLTTPFDNGFTDFVFEP